MFSAFLSFIFFILLIVFIVGFGLIRALMSIFFGKRFTPPTNPFNRRPDAAGNDTGFFTRRSKKKKIFESNDGEYVDYTEVK